MRSEERWGGEKKRKVGEREAGREEREKSIEQVGENVNNW